VLGMLVVGRSPLLTARLALTLRWSRRSLPSASGSHLLDNWMTTMLTDALNDALARGHAP
jgi:hypothetical protein